MSKKLNANLGIVRVPRSRMLKNEVADYAENTIDIVKEYAPESVLITPVFNLLLSKQADIELLRLSYGIDIERLKVEKLKAQLNLRISALKLSVRILKRTDAGANLAMIENAIETYLVNLDKAPNDKVFNQRVAGFLDFTATNEEMDSLINEHGLNNDLMAIAEAHDVYNAGAAKRVKMLSKRSKEPTVDIVKGLFEVIDGLFKTIEVSHLIAPAPVTGEEGQETPDFAPLINELSQLSQMYNRSIAIRRANNLRKAANSEKGGKTEVDAEGELPSNPQPANYLAQTDDADKQAATAFMTIMCNRMDENAAEGVYDAFDDEEDIEDSNYDDEQGDTADE